jgi:hypothetical protein
MPPTQIEFPDLPPPQYLFERDCVSFPARVDGRPVNCLATMEFLMQNFGLRTLDGDAMLEAYQKDREAIQKIARGFIEAGWIGPDNEVLLTRLFTSLGVSVGAALHEWPEGYRLIQNASRRLTDLIGPTAGQVSIEWDRAEGPQECPVISLRISNPSGSVAAVFDPSEMESSSHMQVRLSRLWGDLLQLQSRKQLHQLFSGRIEG